MVQILQNDQSYVNKFIETIDKKEILKLVQWSYLCLFSFTSFIYIAIFWAVEIVKKTKNFIICANEKDSLIFTKKLSGSGAKVFSTFYNGNIYIDIKNNEYLIRRFN